MLLSRTSPALECTLITDTAVTARPTARHATPVRERAPENMDVTSVAGANEVP